MASRGVNKVILVGNLGNDPDIKYTGGGTAICTISLATTNVRKDKDGQQIESTQWHRVKLIGKLGEIAAEYLKKGRQAYIEGRIEYGSYEKDGVKHYTTDIVAEDLQMLGGGGSGAEGSGGGSYSSGRGSGGGRPERGPPRGPQPGPSRGGAPAGDTGFPDDDVF